MENSKNTLIYLLSRRMVSVEIHEKPLNSYFGVFFILGHLPQNKANLAHVVV